MDLSTTYLSMKLRTPLVPSASPLSEEIDKIKNLPVSDEDLKKAKTRARGDLIRSLDSNSGIAEQVAYYQVLTGDWRNLFRSLDKINAVTAADIQRIAKQYLTEPNRTVLG